jgi:putative phage-type endonuclease
MTTIYPGRNNYIGGSDAAAVVGLSPWKTPLELYLEKRGEIEAPDVDNEAMEWGRRLESIVLSKYCEERRVIACENQQERFHPRHSWMMGHLDAIITRPFNRIVEIKTTGHAEQWGSPDAGADGVPELYLLQVYHYMAITGIEEADIAVLIGGQKFRIYSIQYDSQAIYDLLEIEHDFWDRVQRGIPPEPDYSHQSTQALLSRMYPGTDGTTIHLGSAEAWHQELMRARVEIKAFETRAIEAKNHIQMAMGNAAIGRLPGGGEYRRKLVERKGYEVQATKYMDFRFSKGGSRS